MTIMTLAEIAEVVGGECLAGGERIVEGLINDSRYVKEGDLFIPLAGSRTDGHRYIKDALEKGAAGSLCSVDIDLDLPHGAPIVKVEGTLRALHDLARFRISAVKPKIVGVTGSTGKSCTKEMLGSMLSRRCSFFKTPGNYNSEIGLPLALWNLRPEDEVAVLEMAMRGAGQIKELTEIARPDFAVITNIGQVHMEMFNNQEELALAKGEIIENMAPNGIALVNGDDLFCRFLARRYADKKVLTFGFETGDYCAKDIQISKEGRYSFSLCTPWEEFHVTMPLPGKHHVYNALAAAGVADLLGLSPEEIRAGIANYHNLPGRQELHQLHGVTVLDDSYNSNPDSLKAALEQLSYMSQERKIAVLGDMRELGEGAVAAHRNIGKSLESYEVDILLTLGSLAEEIGRSAGSKIEVYSFDNKKSLLQQLLAIIRPGDLVLIKGSRSLGMETFAKSIGEEVEKWQSE